MTPQEIKEKIDNNNQKIESALTPANFVLNTEVQQLMAENERLRAQCTHEFCFGVCKYCYSQAQKEKN